MEPVSAVLLVLGIVALLLAGIAFVAARERRTRGQQAAAGDGSPLAVDTHGGHCGASAGGDCGGGGDGGGGGGD